MTTTVMRDSIVGDDWIYRTTQAVPMQWVVDPKTGQPTGDLLTGPVRLSFETLFTLPQPTKDTPNPKYGSILLFSPWADFTLMEQEYYRLCGLKFPEHYDQQTQQYHGLHSPFRKQEEKLKFGGFTPGLKFITATSKFKPPVVDIRGNPIIDASKVYAGVWAICSVNVYHFIDPRKKGVSFGLQTVMIIGDDTPLAGGAADPNQAFGAVRAGIAAPIVPPNLARQMGGIAPAQAPGVPAIPPHGMPPGAPAPAAYAPPPPPAPGGYAPPMPHVAPAYTPPVDDDNDMSFLN